MSKVALYTTIYSGVEQYLQDWCRSLENQGTREFDIWIGVDDIDRNVILQYIRSKWNLRFISREVDDTPISLRLRALKMMVTEYDALIFSDSDDIMEPTRVSASIQGIQSADIYGCALGLIDATGHRIGAYFGLKEGEVLDDVLPRYNFLGLSNTAWRSETLKNFLSVPKTCVAMDWYLATQAWGNGAAIIFDRTVRMRYRQYANNTAKVVPPFSTAQVINATDIVSEHYHQVQLFGSGWLASHRLKVEEASSRLNKFKIAITKSRQTCDAYVNALNQLPPHHLWWQSVAHPALEDIWNY